MVHHVQGKDNTDCKIISKTDGKLIKISHNRLESLVTEKSEQEQAKQIYIKIY